SAGTSAQSNTVNITITAQLSANFSVSPSSGTANVTTFAFSDLSTGTVSSRTWNFGDGTSSSAANPTHVYTRAGTFTITLTVNGGGASSQFSRSVFVTAPLASAFSYSPANPTTNDTISFSDESTGGVTSWFWVFGDGSTSSDQNPKKRYPIPGTYSVTLTVNRNSEAATAFKSITVAAPAPVTPAATYRSLVSAAAQQAGQGGTSWRTELSLFNAGPQSASVTLIFIPGAGGSIVTRSVFLSPKQSVTYANTLLDLFSIPSGAGAVAIEATSSGADADLRVTSRTFTGGSTGTYGQSVPDVHDDALEQTLYLTGIQSNPAYRTNIGLVNRGNSDVPATLTLYDKDGGTVSTANVTIPAKNFQQASLASYFPEAGARAYEGLSMRMAVSSQNAVTAYASVIDNLSQDPVYIQAMPTRTGNLLTLPIVGRSSGANGTFWRSDVTLFNPANNRLILNLRYSGTTKSLSLGGRETFVLADVVTQMGFSGGSGTLDIAWNGGTGPVVTSRTYTTNDRGGTFGQSIDPVAAFGNTMYVPGLRSDVSFRSNVGFVNGGTETENVTVALLSPAGFEMASATLQLAPKSVAQYGVTQLFDVSASAGNFTLVLRGDANAQLFAYGSMIDNASGDPVFFAGR
ncbi:MAG TPA: PKD domain-containing protein, partial [Vicinamibacterales bacterium]|nr:PKD domain-containing protein [Vicinamibacterales bacterium]